MNGWVYYFGSVKEMLRFPLALSYTPDGWPTYKWRGNRGVTFQSIIGFEGNRLPDTLGEIFEPEQFADVVLENPRLQHELIYINTGLSSNCVDIINYNHWRLENGELVIPFFVGYKERGDSLHELLLTLFDPEIEYVVGSNTRFHDDQISPFASEYMINNYIVPLVKRLQEKYKQSNAPQDRDVPDREIIYSSLRELTETVNFAVDEGYINFFAIKQE